MPTASSPVEAAGRAQLQWTMESNDREIERKYLLRGLPKGIAAFRSVEIDQGYIPGVRVRERVRRVRDGEIVSYVRTIKVGTGIHRFEFEEPTTEAFFAAVWPLTEGYRIRKRRYRVPCDEGFEWEVDEFLDRADLVLAEIELDDENERPDPPEEIGAVIVREVTDELEFGNYRLAK
jgi:CYTH domain-containing protein